MRTIEGLAPGARSMALLGSRILIVEDDQGVAADISTAFEEEGATVIGPLSSIHDALLEADCAVMLDGALLNVSIRDQMGWALANTLLNRDVPIAFATGDEPRLLGERCVSVPDFSAPHMLPMVLNWLAVKISAKKTAGFAGAMRDRVGGERGWQADQQL